MHQCCTRTNQQTTMLFWKSDFEADQPFALRKQERPNDTLSIANASSMLTSFRSLAPLSLPTVAGVCIVEYDRGNTALSVSDSWSKDPAAASEIDLLDPIAGRTVSTDLEALAKRLDRARGMGWSWSTRQGEAGDSGVCRLVGVDATSTEIASMSDAATSLL
jgi:hypothetical protein